MSEQCENTSEYDIWAKLYMRTNHELHKMCWIITTKQKINTHKRKHRFGAFILFYCRILLFHQLKALYYILHNISLINQFIFLITINCFLLIFAIFNYLLHLIIMFMNLQHYFNSYIFSNFKNYQLLLQRNTMYLYYML